jgi:hypothetical protein
MYRYLTFFCVMLFVVTGLALAAPGPSSSTRTLNINGTGSPASPNAVNTATGACNFSAWVDRCSGTNCNCVQVIPSTAGGSMDKGKQTVSNFFVTTDQDINPADNSLVGAPNGRCNPFFGVLTDAVGSTGETKTINLLGTTCKKVTGISKTNTSGNNVGDTLQGGWGITASPAPSPSASGWGTLTGSTTKNQGDLTSKVTIKLMGTVTQ